MFHFDDSGPIYTQLADQLEELIFTGVFQAGDQVPSTTQVSRELHVNPATVLKGMNRLVDDGLLEKRRGRGMFVTKDARQQIMSKRKQHFYDDYIQSVVTEAQKLGLTEEHLIELIKRGYQDDNNAH
ncbi:GntR family transcriptional regulator [Limosilactobacillus difficilis]|uniref:GntR family transcriptional regulator n=1 Tax=Limosilactobacillus difficilis TaxID=2991838 RepID=UPI0024BAC034|nr:GntR family transcriptional regulator [Limosilactobacillus difficilis]